MKKLLAALLVVVSVAQAQVPSVINVGTSGITTPTGPITTHTIGDDGYVGVPLQFGFPLYGKTFTYSFMFDNGVVGFFDPTANIGCNPQVTYCGGNQWSSQPFSTGMGSQFQYMIAPMWSDLAPVAGTTYTTQGNANQMTYSWNNIGEYYNPSQLQSFKLQIKPSGFIGVDYTSVNITSSNVSIGVIGDPALGEFTQHYYGSAGTPIGLGSFMPWNLSGTGVDPCLTNPLYSSTCPGYAEAYLQQQCTISPLYNTACPGYSAAYLQYQCSLDGLFSQQCPNYAEAYALKNLITTTSTSSTTDQTTTSSDTTTTTPTVDSSGEIKVALVADSNVNNVITTTATSASPAQAATATVPLVVTPSPVAAIETKRESAPVAMVVQPATSTESAPQTPRQQLQAKREEAARAKAIKDGVKVAEALGSATDMEQQKEMQVVVMQAMGHTPGFDGYSKAFVPDGVGYKPFSVYNNQKTVDNRRLGWSLFGPSDKLHNDMVNFQYERGN